MSKVECILKNHEHVHNIGNCVYGGGFEMSKEMKIKDMIPCQCSDFRKQIEILTSSLRRCGALAGHPDAKEGCRHICNEVTEALSKLKGHESI